MIKSALFSLQRGPGGICSAAAAGLRGVPFSSPYYLATTTTRLYWAARRGRRALLGRHRPKAGAAVVPVTGVQDDDDDDDGDIPSLSMAKSMPVALRKVDNTSLTTLGAMGNHAALQEMVKRHIMAIDNVRYKEASGIYEMIEKKNHEWENVMAFPFQANIIMCVTAGVISIPLVFHLPTVEFFNEHFVTADHPPIKELETALEVGSWSWNWMEPVLGTSTFLLMSLQYLR